MLKLFTDMLSVALFVFLAENTVFSGALGLGESIRMAKKPRYLVMYSFWTGFFSLSVSSVCYIISRYTQVLTTKREFNVLIFTVVLTAVYLISAFFCRFILHADKKYMNSLGMCAFNGLVIALPVLITEQSLSPASVIGLALGSVAAFILSVLLINSALRHINRNRYIPAFFRGTPALFIYTSLIALSLSCISGGSLFIS